MIHSSECLLDGYILWRIVLSILSISTLRQNKSILISNKVNESESNPVLGKQWESATVFIPAVMIYESRNNHWATEKGDK